MPTNNEQFNNTGQPVGGTDNGVNFRLLKTLSDGTLVTTGGGGGGGTADQGTPNTPENAWPVKLVDAAGVNEAAVDASGSVSVSVENFPAAQPVSGTVAISNFPATQPVSAVALPLPSNAAQETGGNLAAIKVDLDTIKTNTTQLATTQPVSGTISLSGQPITENLTQIGSAVLAPALADAPIGTEIAQIIRDIFRKKGQILSTTPLAANGIFTQGWQDSELTGTCYVYAQGISNVNSAATIGLSIQESDDQVSIRSVFAQGAATTSRAFGTIRARYWRIVFTNGASPQATFTLSCTESSVPIIGLSVSTSSQNEPLAISTAGGAATTLADNQNNQNGAPIQSALSLGIFQQNVCYLYNGLTWDRPRTPNKFNQVSTAANGSTALWAPAAGKKFRVMRFKIQITGDATLALAGRLIVKLLDGANDTINVGHIIYVPAAGLNTIQDYDSGWIDLGNGYLSSAANAVLNINLSGALASGLVNVVVAGTEE